jgi:hypothetical protein
MHEAPASRLDGTYYRNQVDRHLLRRLRALAARRRALASVGPTELGRDLIPAAPARLDAGR